MVIGLIARGAFFSPPQNIPSVALDTTTRESTSAIIGVIAACSVNDRDAR
jgi:hypothetical protein